jgi:hypothetical protein
MAELGLITYQTEYDPQIGCNIPTDITFTPALFPRWMFLRWLLAARRSRGWENLQRKKQSLKPLEMDELIAKPGGLCVSVSAAIRLSVNLMAGSGNRAAGCFAPAEGHRDACASAADP